MQIDPVQQSVRKPKQERAQRTRQGLLAAAARVFSEAGYAKATAKRIASEAGVATGSFYQYFSDKDAALREIALERFARISAEVVVVLEPESFDGEAKEDARRRMRGVVQAVVDYHREDPGMHEVITERRSHDAELDRAMSAGERTLVGRIAQLLEGWGHPGDTEATAFVLFAMVEGAVHAHCLGHPMVSDERFCEALVGGLVLLAVPK